VELKSAIGKQAKVGECSIYQFVLASLYRDYAELLNSRRLELRNGDKL
jgi:hypothetical protein